MNRKYFIPQPIVEVIPHLVFDHLKRSGGFLVLMIRAPCSFGKTFIGDVLFDAYKSASMDVARIETDDSFYCPCCRNYNFDRDLLDVYHRKAQREFQRQLELNTELIIVSNTSCKFGDITVYKQAALRAGYMFMVLDLFALMRPHLAPLLDPMTIYERKSVKFLAFLDHLYAVNKHHVSRDIIWFQMRNYQELPAVCFANDDNTEGYYTFDSKTGQRGPWLR